jgi:hypothetical protein
MTPDQLRAAAKRATVATSPDTAPSPDAEAVRLLREWMRGCSNAPDGRPFECLACTEAFAAAVRRTLPDSGNLSECRAAAAVSEERPYTRAEEVAKQIEAHLATHYLEKHALFREAVALLRAPQQLAEPIATLRLTELLRELRCGAGNEWIEVEATLKLELDEAVRLLREVCQQQQDDDNPVALAELCADIRVYLARKDQR